MDKNTSIRIFNKKLEFIGEVDNYTSLFYIKKWETYGEFEFELSKIDLALIRKGYFIMLNNNGYKSGVIEHIEVQDGERESIKVKGYSLSYLLTQRITVPPINQDYHTFNTDIESIMINLVRSNCIDSRRIPFLKVESSQNRGGTLKFETRYKNLADELTSLSKVSGLGWTMFLDYKNNAFIFKVLESRDLNFNQNMNPPCVFSIEYDNIISQEYISSNIGYKNVGYIGGQGEGATREIIILNNELEGFDRRETFVDARDINENESLHDRGKIKLSEMKEVESFECEVDTKDYEKTWTLGDIVTLVNKKLGLKMNTKIVEVKESYTQNGVAIEPTFGNNIPSFYEKLKQVIEKNESGYGTEIISSTEKPVGNRQGRVWLQIL